MGGSKQKESSGSSTWFSFFSILETKSRRADDNGDAASDDDAGQGVADPGIDRKAEDFITSRKKRLEIGNNTKDDDVKPDPGIDRKAEAFITSRTERRKSNEVAN